MNTYLVGGAVRDELLGRTVHDLDYVVTGATVAQMKALGFMQVGADFPVFLHPQSKDEYALARTERKSAVGHKGFSVDFHPSVSLEEDLQRRDLTINAIAKTENGRFIDPFNGRADLEQRLLRHVSEAFVEDPLRVLRVARFSAQLKPLGFSVHPNTLQLMHQLADSGELSHLTPERVFKETEKALLSRQPQQYFRVLQSCGALVVLFPELQALIGVSQEVEPHAGLDFFVHSLMAVEQASLLSELPEVRWAALLHDLGKGVTADDLVFGDIAYQAASITSVQALNKRYKVPNRYAVLAEKVAEHQLTMQRVMALTPANILKLLESLDAFRRPQLLVQFILVCEAAVRRRGRFEKQHFPAADFLREAYRVCQQVIAKPFVKQGIKGIEINHMMRRQRVERLGAMKATMTLNDF
jgi:tRNA nucleotidyltransferase (CCA-adding enzyme)